MKSKKKNKYDIVIQPITIPGVGYVEVAVTVRKNISQEERSRYAKVVHKKICSYLRENLLSLQFYGINKFSV